MESDDANDERLTTEGGSPTHGVAPPLAGGLFDGVLRGAEGASQHARMFRSISSELAETMRVQADFGSRVARIMQGVDISALTEAGRRVDRLNRVALLAGLPTALPAISSAESAAVLERLQANIAASLTRVPGVNLSAYLGRGLSDEAFARLREVVAQSAAAYAAGAGIAAAVDIGELVDVEVEAVFDESAAGGEVSLVAFAQAVGAALVIKLGVKDPARFAELLTDILLNVLISAAFFAAGERSSTTDTAQILSDSAQQTEQILHAIRELSAERGALATPSTPSLVTETKLRLRAGPGANHEVLAVIQGGTALRLYEIESGWCYVAFEDEAGVPRTGWVSAQYVETASGAASSSGGE